MKFGGGRLSALLVAVAAGVVVASGLGLLATFVYSGDKPQPIVLGAMCLIGMVSMAVRYFVQRHQG